MTIASEIARLQGVKADILGAIAEKKVDVPAGAMLADAPDLIRSIKNGINVKIGQGVYPAVKIGNQLWLAKNLDEELGTIGVDEWYYNGRSVNTYINAVNSTYKALSSAYQPIYVYDWNDGHTSSNNLSDKSNIPGKYIRVHFVATMNKAQSAPVTVTTRFAAWDKNYSLIGSYGRNVIGSIPAGETTKTFDLSFEASELNLEGIARFDFITTTSGTGIDGTTKISFTDIKIFSSTEPYTSTPTNDIAVPQALANEATAKANNYGRLYTWNNVNNNLSKLGLTKWRVPSRNDFAILSSFLGGDSLSGKKLKSTKGWQSGSAGFGTDDYGFNALPSGYYNVADGYFADLGSYTNFWTNESRYYRYLSYNTNNFNLRNEGNTDQGYCLRLVMDLSDDGTIPDSNIVLEDVPATTAEPLALASEPIVTEEE